MIDVIVDVYNIVKKAIKPLCKYSGVIDTDVPPKFPYVVVEQLGAPINRRMATSENPEEGINMTVQMKVYTDGESSYSDNLDIQALANDAMIKMGFTRYYGFSAQKNVLDASILCYVARFKGVVDTEAHIYNS